jgi:histidinol-phosphate aminotransferase
MSPTPVTYTSPTAPSTYSWEATNEEVASRYGLRADEVVRFDLNTSPVPPAMVGAILAAGRFETPLSEYPPSDYARLTAAAAARYGVARDELLVGAGADEVLDLVAKAFLAPGLAAVVPTPTYSMYRVLTEQRGARVIDVPRRAAAAGWVLDPAPTRRAARDAAVVWLCSPNNPTGLPEPEGVIDWLLSAIADDADAAGRPRPIVVVDEAYAEFVGWSTLELRDAYPELIVIRTLSKAYGLAGLRVGFAVARPATIARMAPYRPPGSVSTVSVTIASQVLASDDVMAGNIGRVVEERPRLIAGLVAAGLDVGESVTNFVLAGLGSPERAGAIAEELMRRGMVPRTFGAGHPLAAWLRLTVRDRADNDRLVAAINEIVAAGLDRPAAQPPEPPEETR